MASISGEAAAYEPPKTKNIADLERVPTDIEVEERDYTKKEDGSTFKLKVIIVDEEEYRVPVSVLAALKVIMEEKTDLKYFKVKKFGEGMNTTYTIVTLE